MDIISRNNHQQQLCSPVMDSITLDTLQSVNGKCEIIERQLQVLDSNIMRLNEQHFERDRPSTSFDDDLSDYTTQQLRQRFQTIISDDCSLRSSNQQPPININDDD